MSNNPLVRKLLNGVRLSAEQQSLLDRLAVNVRTVKRHSHIISEGDRPDCVHLVLGGWAARCMDLKDGPRQIVGFLLPGDFGDLHAPILPEMDHGIVAMTDCRVAHVPPEAIDELMNREPVIARAMWWATLVEEAVLRSWIANIGRRGAVARIAHLICELKRRLDMVGLGGEDEFELPLRQEDIADATGLTPIHVNRMFHQLRAENVLVFRKHQLTLLDLDKLKKIAGFDPNYLHLSPQ